MRNLHLFSLLLSYPTEDLQSVCGEIEARLQADTALPSDTVNRLRSLLTRIATSDIYAAQETYVDLFDRGRTYSLHMFEHVHGESRDRGQAMVDLRERYIVAGLEPSSNELPDFLPLFLDYCSTLPDTAAREALAEPGVVLVALAARLAERGSDYAPLLALLCDIAGLEHDAEAQTALSPADDPEDLEALDAAWEEEQITFGAMAPSAPDAAACPIATQQIAAMHFEQGA
jgi:nitrate reductase molybdenum cofactor assembly chaperone NarJ/NarW